MFNPLIIEKFGKTVHTFDIDTKLFQNRIVYVTGEVDEDLSKQTVTQLLYLDSVDHSDISLYINSPGGNVTDGLAIVDTINAISSKVQTVGVGLCASMGAILLMSGNTRRCTKNCQILLHTVSSCTGYSDVHQSRVDFEHQDRMNNTLSEIICEKSNLKPEELKELTQHDCWLSAEKALEYGIIDSII